MHFTLQNIPNLRFLVHIIPREHTKEHLEIIHNTHTKIRIFKSNVIGVLLFGSESWKWHKSITHKLDVFRNRCIRRIFRANKISNEDLHLRTNTTPMSTEIRRMRWRWIWYTYMYRTCRMKPAAILMVAMRWSPVIPKYICNSRLLIGSVWPEMCWCAIK